MASLWEIQPIPCQHPRPLCSSLFCCFHSFLSGSAHGSFPLTLTPPVKSHSLSSFQLHVALLQGPTSNTALVLCITPVIFHPVAHIRPGWPASHLCPYENQQRDCMCDFPLSPPERSTEPAKFRVEPKNPQTQII